MNTLRQRISTHTSQETLKRNNYKIDTRPGDTDSRTWTSRSKYGFMIFGPFTKRVFLVLRASRSFFFF